MELGTQESIVQIWIKNGNRYALFVGVGRKYVFAIPNLPGRQVRVHKIERKVAGPLEPVDYPVEKFRDRLRANAKRYGASDEAKPLLRRKKQCE